MRDDGAGRTGGIGPDFNLLLIADPREPRRFRVAGTIRLSGGGDPYEELAARLERLLSLRGGDGGAAGPEA